MATFDMRFRPEEIANLQRIRQLEEQRKKATEFFAQFLGGGGPSLNPHRDMQMQQILDATSLGDLGEGFFGSHRMRDSTQFQGMSRGAMFGKLQNAARNHFGQTGPPKSPVRSGSQLVWSGPPQLSAFPSFQGRGGPFGNPFGAGRRGVR